LAQIRSSVPEIFEPQTKVTDGAKNRTLLACDRDIQKAELKPKVTVNCKNYPRVFISSCTTVVGYTIQHGTVLLLPHAVNCVCKVLFFGAVSFFAYV